MRKIKSKKGDMSINIIIAIVIGLAIMLVMIFMFMGKSKTMAKTGTCPGECANCNFGEKRVGSCTVPCPENKPNLGLHPCKIDDKTDGRCCMNI